MPCFGQLTYNVNAFKVQFSFNASIIKGTASKSIRSTFVVNVKFPFIVLWEQTGTSKRLPIFGLICYLLSRWQDQ